MLALETESRALSRISGVWSSRAGVFGSVWLGLVITGCAQATPRAEAATAEVVEARLDAEARAAALENEIRLLRQELAAVRRHQVAAQREQARLLERIDRLLELELLGRAPSEADRPVAHTLYRRELPQPNPRQLEQRAMLRAIDRLDLSTQQKQALIRMLDSPRALDDENPWNDHAEWH